MAVLKKAFWIEEEGFDMHLLWPIDGIPFTTRPLFDKLTVMQDDGVPFPAHTVPNAQIEFIGLFDLDEFESGIAIDAVTGEITISQPTVSPVLTSFMLIAQITDTNVAGFVPIEVPMRIHLHNSIKSAWLSPPELSIRPDGPNVRFSILAQFDDDVIGDLSDVSGITWSNETPSPPAQSVSINSSTGEMSTSTTGKTENIKAVLSWEYNNVEARGKVKTITAWKDIPVSAQILDGSPAAGLSGAAKQTEIDTHMNVLFIPDGYKSGEEKKFESLVKMMVKKIGTNTSLSPFDHFAKSKSINYWWSFVASPERGTTVLHELVPRIIDGKAMGHEVIRSVSKGFKRLTELEALINVVGLPLLADDSVSFSQKQTHWTTLYGPHFTSLTFDLDLFLEWQSMNQWSLADERDTALGASNGSRPKAQNIGNTKAPDRLITLNKRRTTRGHMDIFLDRIPGVGKYWKSGQKDALFVIVLCPTRYGGAMVPRNQLLFSSLEQVKMVEVKTKTGTNAFTIEPFPVRTSNLPNTLAIIIHEAGHALRLADEYGGKNIITASEKIRLRRIFLNVQHKEDLLNSSSQIMGENIKWRWPRISKAGVLEKVELNGSGLKLTLKKGHAAEFSSTDKLRLRKRELLTISGMPVAYSKELVVETIEAGDIIKVKASDGTALSVAHSTGDILFVGTPAPASAAAPDYPFAELLPKIMMVHINSSHKPQTAPCIPDDNKTSGGLQDPIDLPAGLPARPPYLPIGRPWYTPWIVGLYEGGHATNCEVYHPTGICLMRALQVPTENDAGKPNPNADEIYRFCPVCKYALVEIINPTKHKEIDQHYNKYYIQPI